MVMHTAAARPFASRFATPPATRCVHGARSSPTGQAGPGVVMVSVCCRLWYVRPLPSITQCLAPSKQIRPPEITAQVPAGAPCPVTSLGRPLVMRSTRPLGFAFLALAVGLFLTAALQVLAAGPEHRRAAWIGEPARLEVFQDPAYVGFDLVPKEYKPNPAYFGIAGQTLTLAATAAAVIGAVLVTVKRGTAATNYAPSDHNNSSK
jgi:hypothetical protein